MESNVNPKTRYRRFARDTMIIVTVSIALLVVLEFVLGVVSDESYDIYRHHETYGMEIGAGVRSKFDRPPWHGGETIQWQTNSSGFRGEELVDNPDMRIVVYGDSNVFAMFSEHPNTFTGKLATILTEKLGRAVEVVNAGTVGYGPDQNLLRFEQEAKILQPDLVIFHVFADNDFGDIIRNRLFQLDGSRLVRSEQPLVEDSYLNSEPSLQIMRMVFRLRRDLVQKIFGSGDGPVIPRDQRGLSPDQRSRKIVVDLLNQRQKEFELYQAGAPRRFSYLSDEYDIDMAIKPDSLAARAKEKLMEGVLARVSAFSRAEQIPLMV